MNQIWGSEPRIALAVALTPPTGVRSVARVLQDVPCGPLETAVSRQVITFGASRLDVESLLDRTAIVHAGDPAHFSRVQRNLADALVADLRQRLLQEVERLEDFEGSREIRHLPGRTLQLARIATERADEVLQDRGTRRLRAMFAELMNAYGQIGAWRMRRPDINAYLKRFQVFEAAVGHEFHDRLEVRLVRPAALLRTLRRGIGCLRRRILWPQRSAGHGENKKGTE